MSSGFANVCRACNTEAETLSKLSSIDADFVEYGTKLYFCVPTIRIDDEQYPQQLCDSCIVELRAAYKFKHKCLNSMCAFSEVVKNEKEHAEKTIVIKDEVHEQIDEELSHDNSETIDKSPLEVPESNVELDDSLEDLLTTTYEDAIEEEYDVDHSYFIKTYDDRNDTTLMSPDGEMVQSEMKQELADSSVDNSESEMRDSAYHPIFDSLLQPEQTQPRQEDSEDIMNKVIASFNAPRRKRPAVAPFFCTICSVGFEEEDCEAHSRLHKDGERIMCPLCTRQFDTKDGARQFFRHYCPQADKPAFLLTCTICYRKFKSSQALANHRKIHDCDDAGYHCNICDLYFVSLRKLDWHYRNGIHRDKKTKKLRRVNK